MATVDDTLEDDDYDEFSLLHENAEEWGLELAERPVVERRTVDLPSGRLSYLRWGAASPRLVLLHGGGQNAHTWDSVVLALGEPALAVDLPGHGRSARRPDRDYGPWRNAEAVAELLERVVEPPVAVVGMSLGGATTIRLAATRPDLVERATVIDITPAITTPGREMSPMERGSVALIGGPPTYATFDEMADAAIALSPYRAASGVRRGVRHNAYRRADGRWTWRYDLFAGDGGDGESPRPRDFASLWDDVGSIDAPLMFVRGGESRYVLDEDEDEMRRRLPGLRVERVAGAGHAVQSDQPVVLAELLRSFLAG